MYKRVNVKKLGRKKSHRVSLIQNQVRTLFNNGVLKTTTVKAKAVKSVTQSLLSDMEEKEISLETRRKLKKILGNKELVEKALQYVQTEDHGVRIRKVGFRSGDNAEISRVELIGFLGKRKGQVEKSEKKEKEVKSQESKKSRKTNKDIDKKETQKTASGKTNRAQRKSTQRVRTRSGL
jgi:large subunit ribosomal protein L17